MIYKLYIKPRWIVKLDKAERKPIKSGEFSIDENKFEELLEKLRSIDWEKAYIKNSKNRNS